MAEVKEAEPEVSDVSMSDEEDEVAEVVVQGKKQSKMLSIKKFFASATASSKLGRKIILDVLGEEGHELLSALKDATSEHLGNSKGKEKRKQILKIALKVNIMVQEKMFTEESLAKISDAWRIPAKKLLLLFEQKTEEDVKPKIEELAADADKIRGMLLELLKGKMRAKNLTMTDELVKYYTSPAFMLFVLDPAHKAFCERISDALHIVLQPFLVDVILEGEEGIHQPCSKYGCRLNRLGRRASFTGSLFCSVHHAEYVESLKAPRFTDLLNENASLGILCEFVGPNTPERQQIELWRTCQKFRDYSAATRPSRARMIVQKFLSPKLPPAQRVVIPDAVFQKIDAGKDNAHRGLFDDAQQFVLGLMEKNIKDNFIKSPAYKDWIKTISLRPSHQKILEEEKKKMAAFAAAAKADEAKEPPKK